MNTSFQHQFRYAFVKSIRVMCGYIFLGIAFGISLQEAGYNFIWALLMSLCIYAGSLQFVMIPLLVSNAGVMTVAITTIFVNCRHIFYGISFVEAFKNIKGKLYMIFGLTDETYSVLCGCKQEDPKEAYKDSWLLITAINHSYWVLGSVIGGLLGNILPFDFTGIDFSMTALFIVIVLEQVLSGTIRTKLAAGTGILAGVICLLIFGTDGFLLPAMVVTVFLLTAASLGGKTWKKEEKEGEGNGK